METRAKKGRKKIGRPPVASADRREIALRVLVTAEEQSELQEAAERAAMSLSTWVRAVALERARDRKIPAS